MQTAKTLNLQKDALIDWICTNSGSYLWEQLRMILYVYTDLNIDT